MLLIYPPIARSTEAPLGLARLAGFLKRQGLAATCLDLNQEGQDYLLSLELEAGDTWGRGALRRRAANLALLRGPEGYKDRDRYSRAVHDLGRALALAGGEGISPGLADYRDGRLSPLKKADLLRAAADFEANPFFPLFEKRLGEALEAGAHPSPGSETRDRTGMMVGISLIFLSQALSAFALIGFIKKNFPQARILLGGGLVTSWLSQGSLDEGESFGGLVDALLPGRGEDALGRFLGLEPEGRRFFAAQRPVFEDFSDQGYFAPGLVLPYSFSTGCPWRNCSFCPEKAEKSPYVALRADAAMAELRFLVEAHRPLLLHFTENEIAPLYLRALSLSPPGAPWYGFARFTPLLADPLFCRALAAAGCSLLQLGLESGDQGVLDALGKGTDLGLITLALKNLREAGIGVYLYVLFGTPSEDRVSALVTRDFLEARAAEIGYLNIAIFNMPVSSPEARLYSSRAFYDGELSLYCEFSHPKGWNRAEVRDFLARELETRPGIRTILRRTPPIFTSNHAPFFPLTTLS